MTITTVKENKTTGDILIIDKSGKLSSFSNKVWSHGNAFPADAEAQMTPIVDQNEIARVVKQSHIFLPTPSLATQVKTDAASAVADVKAEVKKGVDAVTAPFKGKEKLKRYGHNVRTVMSIALGEIDITIKPEVPWYSKRRS